MKYRTYASISSKSAVDVHHQYYSQFVDSYITTLVLAKIGKDKILASTDYHLNDIPLRLWDTLHWDIKRHCYKAVASTGNQYSLSTTVCIAKTAARIIIAITEEDNCV